MTDREKLIELLFDVPEATVYNRAAPKIADYLLANGVTVQQWISVDDDLPKQGEKVLVKTKTGGKFVIGYNHIFKRWSCAQSITVTHWMHLPD